MTVTNSPRLGIPDPSAGSDPFTRPQYEQLVAQLEALGAIGQSGTFSARPAAGLAPRFYVATDTHQVFLDVPGSGWQLIAVWGGATLPESSIAGLTADLAALYADNANSLHRTGVESKAGQLTLSTGLTLQGFASNVPRHVQVGTLENGGAQANRLLDGSGAVAWAHNHGAGNPIPATVLLGATTTNTWGSYSIVAIDAANITARFYDRSGAAMGGATVNFFWHSWS